MNCRICNNSIDTYPCHCCGYDGTESQNPHYLEPGSTLSSGRFRIGQVVGAGGFGVTYLAWDVNLTRRVAIKEYMPGEFSTRMPGSTILTVYGGEKREQFEAGMLKFHDESERLSRFTEVPGIVQIFDCFYENNTAYIVMEYLEGETLDAKIAREGKVDVSEAVDIMVPILDALTEVHKEGIIHRDIAPNNIFITTDGKVKLLDFGAARAATGSHSKSLTVLYKEGFTAEEQYQSNGTQGAWTDVYSAAATLYKAVTGITPDGAMERRLKDRLEEPVKIVKDIPKYVNKAILNALNVDYKIRTQTAEEFKEELVGKQGVKNRFKRTRERGTGHIPRQVWIASSAFVAGIALLITLQLTGIVDFQAAAWNIFNKTDRMMNLVNMDVEEARKRLEETYGLEMEIVETEYDKNNLKDVIIEQDPQSGENVDRDTVTTVKVKIRKKAELTDIPDITGKVWNDTVSKEMDAVPFRYNVIKKEGSAPAGMILGTYPSCDGVDWQNNTIDVYVSKGVSGRIGEEYVLDTLEGMNLSEARNLLASHGIYLTVSETRMDLLGDDGEVLEQSVNPGTAIKSGETVNVVVSTGIDEEDVIKAGQLTDDIMLQYLKDSIIWHETRDQILEQVDKDASYGSQIAKAKQWINTRRRECKVEAVYPTKEMDAIAAQIARDYALGRLVDANKVYHHEVVRSAVTGKSSLDPNECHGFYTNSAGNVIVALRDYCWDMTDSFAVADDTEMGVGEYTMNGLTYYYLIFR